MGLILEASFPEDGIFFAGDSFSCILTFTNTSNPHDPSLLTDSSSHASSSAPVSPSSTISSSDSEKTKNRLSAPPTAPSSLSDPRAKDDLSVKTNDAPAAASSNRISFTQMVRKSISLSSLRTIIPLGGGGASKPPLFTLNGSEADAKKPFLDSVKEAEEDAKQPTVVVTERRSADGAFASSVPPIVSITGIANSTGSNNNISSPSLVKAPPRLTGVIPPAISPNPLLKPSSDASLAKRTPPVTPTTLPKNPLNDTPLRSLSIDLPRPPQDLTTILSPSEDVSEQIQLSNVDDVERAPSRLSVISSAALSPRPDRSNSPLPFSEPSPSPLAVPSPLSAGRFSAPPVSPPSIPSVQHQVPGLASAPLPRKHHVKAEDLAWAFAQMTGNLTVDSSYVKTTTLEPLKSRTMYSVGGAGPGGGGSMGGSGLGFDSYSKPQEKSRTRRIQILQIRNHSPPELPPTHRGKIIRFSYKLIVGIQRTGTSKRSQVIQLPFRVFGRVEGDGSKIVYEILNPVIVNTEEAVITPVVNKGVCVKPQRVMKTEDDDKLTLMQNLTLICQRSGKLSFDICKNNEHVAQLKLTRGLYRLGEIITGILDFSKSSVPCFQVSAFLENSESVDAPFSVKPKHQMVRATRRVFAEQHRYTVNVCKTGISLPIPLGCTPDFKTTAVSLSWVLRLEFITGLSPMLLAPAASDVNFVHLGVMNHADVEAFDCLIPLKVYPTKMVRKAMVRQFDVL
ncbi:Rgp1-domain-containing protein [Chytridium lagenaria]|nr:Rgp1-domain-containing protein [Chytridium lagenaria]